MGRTAKLLNNRNGFHSSKFFDSSINHFILLLTDAYQSIVFLRPSSKGVFAVKLKAFFAFETSRHLRGCPSGFVTSQTMVPLKPTRKEIFSASARMDISIPEPRLTGPFSL